jgi:hypothetical protein
VICGAALRRQRREKRLFMAAGVWCGQAESMEVCDLIGGWRQGISRADGQGWYRAMADAD